jgi:hypothetical protein
MDAIWEKIGKGSKFDRLQFIKEWEFINEN